MAMLWLSTLAFACNLALVYTSQSCGITVPNTIKQMNDGRMQSFFNNIYALSHGSNPFTLNYQNAVDGTADVSSDDFFTSVDWPRNAEGEWTDEVYASFFDLADKLNHWEDVAEADNSVAVERFLQAVADDPARCVVHQFLVDHGLAGSFGADEDAFLEYVRRAWFENYPSNVGQPVARSGFEVVFLGEANVRGKFDGGNDATYLAYLEEQGRFNYHGHYAEQFDGSDGSNFAYIQYSVTDGRGTVLKKRASMLVLELAKSFWMHVGAGLLTDPPHTTSYYGPRSVYYKLNGIDIGWNQVTNQVITDIFGVPCSTAIANYCDLVISSFPFLMET